MENKMNKECDICSQAEATTKYKSGLRGQCWEYYCDDCDHEYGYENEQAGYEQQDIEEAE
jgi:transposase-like protein